MKIHFDYFVNYNSNSKVSKEWEERVPQSEERGRNEITFFQKERRRNEEGTKGSKSGRIAKGTNRSFCVPFQQIFSTNLQCQNENYFENTFENDAKT